MNYLKTYVNSQNFTQWCEVTSKYIPLLIQNQCIFTCMFKVCEHESQYECKYELKIPSYSLSLLLSIINIRTYIKRNLRMTFDLKKCMLNIIAFQFCATWGEWRNEKPDCFDGNTVNCQQRARVTQNNEMKIKTAHVSVRFSDFIKRDTSISEVDYFFDGNRPCSSKHLSVKAIDELTHQTCFCCIFSGYVAWQNKIFIYLLISSLCW